MSITPLTSEPAAVFAGDTLAWTIALPDYPASGGWTLKYTGVCAAGQLAITSAASGDDHAVTAAKAVTAAWTPGTYTLTKYVESADERITLATLTLDVRPDLAGKATAYDNRSHVKRVLDAIEAVLEGTATTDQQELTIDGTSIKRRSVADLLTLRGVYAHRYWQERNPGKLAPTVTMRFTR